MYSPMLGIYSFINKKTFHSNFRFLHHFTFTVLFTKTSNYFGKHCISNIEVLRKEHDLKQIRIALKISNTWDDGRGRTITPGAYLLDLFCRNLQTFSMVRCQYLRSKKDQS